MSETAPSPGPASVEQAIVAAWRVAGYVRDDRAPAPQPDPGVGGGAGMPIAAPSGRAGAPEGPETTSDRGAAQNRAQGPAQ